MPGDEDLEDMLGEEGEYLEDDDSSLEDDDGELGVDYHDSIRDVQEREGRKDKRFSTGMSGAQELSSALHFGDGVRLRDASGEGVRVNPTDVKVLRAGEVDRIEVTFKNGRRLIITG